MKVPCCLVAVLIVTFVLLPELTQAQVPICQGQYETIKNPDIRNAVAAWARGIDPKEATAPGGSIRKTTRAVYSGATL
jgi:hypothetical protein